MFDRLRHRLQTQRERRLLYRSTHHLDARTLRDIGLNPAEYPRPSTFLFAICR